MCVWFDGWVGGWVGSCQITKNLLNLAPIKIIKLCLKIYDLWRYSPPVGRCMGCWVDEWVHEWGHVKSLNIE